MPNASWIILEWVVYVGVLILLLRLLFLRFPSCLDQVNYLTPCDLIHGYTVMTFMISD